MSYKYDSGWIRRDNGSSLSWDGTGRYVKTATVRFRGVGLYQTLWTSLSTNSGSGSGSLGTSLSYPAPPSGYSFLSHEAQLGYRNTSGTNVSCSWRIGHWTSPIASGSHTAVHNTQYTRYGYRSSQKSSEDFSYTQTGSFNWATGTRTQGERTLGTTNPTATVNSIATTHSGTLSNGSYSSTMNINGLLGGNGDGKNNTIAFSSTGSGLCEVRVIIEWATNPAVSTNAATSIGSTSAVLNGNLTNTGNHPCSVYFYWRKKNIGDYQEQWVAERTSTGTYNFTLLGLDINTEYQFYARAWNWFGANTGSVLEFSTIATLPNVNSDTTNNINYTEANINGELDNDGGLETTCYFEYGKTTSYELGIINKGAHYAHHWFGELLTSLDFDTLYYWRAYGVNAVGRNNGVQKSFTTPYPYIVPPINRLPLANARFEEGQVEFSFDLTVYAPNPASKYHARLRFSELVEMNPTIHNYQTKDSQTGWEYFHVGDNEWKAFPSAGVDPDTKVRFTTPVGSNLPIGPTYWDCASWDGERYGENAPVRVVRILVEVDEIYTLLIDSVAHSFIGDLVIVEASNGETGRIDFTLSNHEGEADSISFGDSVIVAVKDHEDNIAEFAGRVRKKDPVGFVVKITAILGDGFFGERVVGVSYISQDIGQAVSSIVSSYCSPLTTTEIDTTTGYSAPVVSINETPSKVFEELRKNYGVFYFVDRDNVVHFYKKESISASSRTIRGGSGDFSVFPPIVATKPASNIAATTADLNGNLTDIGDTAASVYFRWREKGVGEWNEQWLSEENAPTAFNYSLTLLSASTTYEFYTRAWNGTYNSYGDTLEFTTLSE